MGNNAIKTEVMKVTIISNGTHQIVLTPETPLEILAIKELENKAIVSSYHASTQILEQSAPNCLVITPVENNTKQDFMESINNVIKD